VARGRRRVALAELARRRPGLRIGLFGEGSPLPVAFPHRNHGVLERGELAALYREAAVGVVLSMTNPSLIPLEMLACGLPCVELASESMLAEFGRDGALELAEFDPVALCDAVERMLDDAALRERRLAAGRALVAERTWARAAEQVEEGLRRA
jgi:glycosyltransferase involved in cell wall biosynthesis